MNSKWKFHEVIYRNISQFKQISYTTTANLSNEATFENVPYKIIITSKNNLLVTLTVYTGYYYK